MVKNPPNWVSVLSGISAYSSCTLTTFLSILSPSSTCLQMILSCTWWSTCKITVSNCRPIWITLRCEKKKWLMSINPEKCEIIQVYQKRTPLLFNYTLQGMLLKTVPNTKYLGLFYPKMWNGTPIITRKVTAKGYRTLGFLKQRPEGKFAFSKS